MQKLSTYHKILIGVLLGLTIVLVIIINKKYNKSESIPESTELYEVSENDSGQASVEVAPEELKKIRLWIEDKNLDEYGNLEGTIYAGGNPLFDESTGETRLIYDYLLENHPDKPWQNYGSEDINNSSDMEESISNESNLEQELSFSEITEWSNLSKPSYDMEYPKFVNIEDKNDIITLTGDDNFKMYIYNDISKQDIPTDLNCDKMDLIDKDNAFICNNDSIRYKQIYQRVKDSVIPK